MQIVIEISEERYQDIQRIAEVQTGKRMLTCEQIIANGTPLPKGHGRLIDADALEQEMIIAEGKAEGGCDYYMADTIDRAKEYIIDSETIIEADKAESGG